MSLAPTDPEYKHFTPGKVAQEVKEYIALLSNPLGPTFFDSIVFNGAIDQDQCVFGKRQEGGQSQGCSRPATSSVLSTLITTVLSSATSLHTSVPTTTSQITTSSLPSSTISSTTSNTVSSSIQPSATLECHQNIPIDGPTPSEVAGAIRGANDISLNFICDAKFDGSGTSTQMTFNHGTINIIVGRMDDTKPLQYCQESMKAIINTCIIGTKDYGGVFAIGGESYNITNMIWPQNPLLPGVDPGAPTPTPTPSSSRAPPPPGQTVTVGGAICVLRPGSVTPNCHPIETPTPNPAGTNIHVETGCISVNGQSVCAGNPDNDVYHVDSNPNEPWYGATIYGFDPNDHFYGKTNPKCEVSARWPGDLTDIYFKFDNCLYDGNGAPIFDGVCCRDESQAMIENPYGVPPPPPPEEEPTCTCYGFWILGKCVGWEDGDGCGRI